MFKRYVYIEGLTNLHGSKGKFLINNDGQVKDIKGNDVEYCRDGDGNKIVYCLGWAGEQWYRVIDLVAIQFKSLYIPETDYHKVKAFVIDGDPDNTHARNIGYRFIDGKLKCKDYPGYFYIPGLTSSVINITGGVLSVRTGEKRTFYITQEQKEKNIKGGYYVFTAMFQRGKHITYSRHRALCLVFKEYPDNVDELVVNHINGIPGDDRLDNLEWTTRGENNKHAYENNLKNQQMAVLVRNVITGEVKEYYSISECARQLGFPTDETIRQRIISSSFGKVFSDGTQVKLSNDKRDWIIPEDHEAAIRQAMRYTGVPVIARNCKTFEEKQYEKMTDVEKDIGIQSGSVNARLILDNRKPLFGYQFKYFNDKRSWLDFTEKEYLDSFRPAKQAVSCRNLITKEEKTFSSIHKASMSLNKHGFRYRLTTEQPLFEDGWQIKYSEDDWEEVRDFEEVIYKLQKDMTARNELTGNIIIADSATKMAQVLKCDPKAIRRAAFTRGNMLYKGYRFRLGVSMEPWPDTDLNLAN